MSDRHFIDPVRGHAPYMLDEGARRTDIVFNGIAAALRASQ